MDADALPRAGRRNIQGSLKEKIFKKGRHPQLSSCTGKKTLSLCCMAMSSRFWDTPKILIGF